jgi:hypothetical protein
MDSVGRVSNRGNPYRSHSREEPARSERALAGLPNALRPREITGQRIAGKIFDRGVVGSSRSQGSFATAVLRRRRIMFKSSHFFLALMAGGTGYPVPPKLFFLLLNTEDLEGRGDQGARNDLQRSEPAAKRPGMHW